MKRTPILLLVVVMLTLLAACGIFKNIPIASPAQATLPASTATSQPTETPAPTASLTPVPEARISEGQTAIENGDWDKAKANFATALDESQASETQFVSRLGLARTKAFEEGLPSTIEDLAQLVTENTTSPERAEAFFLLGQAYDSAERFQEAADTYLEYIKLRPGVIDTYAYDLRGQALFNAGNYAEAIQSFDAALQSPGAVDPITLRMKIARSMALNGDTTGAMTLYEEISSLTNNDSTKALINLRKGQIYTSLGQTDMALAAYQDNVSNYPKAYESYSALLELVAAGVPVDDLDRGLVDFFAGEYGVALAAFDRYLNNNPGDPATALYYSGLVHQASGRYEEAISFYDEIITNYPDHPYWDKAWEEKGFTEWYYLDQNDRALETFVAFATNHPTHARAAEFLDEAARVAERNGLLEKAAEFWRSLAMQYPSDERASDALFYSALSRYRIGDFTSALQDFKGALGISQSLSDRARASLWIGKTLHASDNITEAQKTWEQTTAMDPTGYYSERARDYITQQPAFTPPDIYDIGVNLKAERDRAKSWLQVTFNLPENTELDGTGELSTKQEFARGAELWNLGLQEEARQEFDTLLQSVKFDPVLSYRLADYLYQTGLFRSAAFAARNVLDLAGFDDASSLTAPAYFNHIRFGTHYADLVIPTAQEFGFHPIFIFSLIRQESLFESFVRSSAAARGLMQIIPSTGLEVAEKIGWPVDFTADDLNRPLVNIKLGTQYLAYQRDYFAGDLYAALAAYNGGPGNAAAWKELAANDQDLFLEIIRFKETRDYIRRIYEIFNIYRRLYNRTP